MSEHCEDEVYEFTKDIPENKRIGTRFENLPNWDEKNAKENQKLACHDCRWFMLNCYGFVGEYHKTCAEFEWW